MTHPGDGEDPRVHEAANTETIEQDEGPTTSRIETPSRDGVHFDLDSLRAAMKSRAWIDAAAAASIAWLALLCVAAILLLAPKLQYPGFAKGANPVDILTGMVIVGLGILRVPIQIGGLTLVALPLGALIAVAIVIGWATRAGLESVPEATARPARAAARVATIFALHACWLSLAFRFRGEEPAGANAGWALVLGFVWAFLFAWLALIRRREPWRIFSLRILGAVRTRFPSRADGLVAGMIMLAAAALLAGAGLLLWIIVGLARDLPYGGFGIGDAGAAVMYLAAFMPNVLVALITLSLGAPVYRGAQIGLGGRKIGALHELSLIHWPGGAPWFAYLLLGIPLVACLLGGFWIARRHAGEGLWRSLLIAAATFSISLAFLGWLGEARVGAGLIEQKGFARVAISPLRTLGWGMLWSLVCGWLGSELGLRSKKEGAPS